jgi:hypothetical protein
MSLLGGLQFVMSGERFPVLGTGTALPADRRPFLGWVTGRHWLLTDLA